MAKVGRRPGQTDSILGPRPLTLLHHVSMALQRSNDAGSAPSALPSTVLKLRHKGTGAECYLLGVIHGAKASEDDVRTIIQG
jgi:hypothetical protein